ncbi:MAG TPA: M1 family metallopeptidase [Thermoanaerobaculia bacterium]|nr:M1 family metallopeptidase [Thermoanaerobaculia bacterium]
MTLRPIALLVALSFSLPLAAARLPRTVLPHHYDLTITPDIAAETFSGDAVILAGVQQPVSSIVLNAAEIAFRSASVESGGARQNATITTDAAAETATLTLDEPLAIGPATIRIAYDGILNRQLRGFYAGDSSRGKYLASQMEAVDARRAFPSFDEPDMKATFRLTVVADASHNVISNSAIESETPGPAAGKKTVRFALTPRLSTYHIALIVGHFACIGDTADGIPLRICATPDRVEMARTTLQATRELVTFFNRYFEIDYPFGKIDQIALPDFAAGAMENPGAITYRERILLADPKTASAESLKASVSTISHELAHMWFGNLVTMRWWDDIWLNEGFASWMGRKGLEAVRPQWKLAASDAAGAASPMRSDVLATTRQIHKSAETPDEIEELFDGIAYGKAAALLRMLETWVGEDRFREGINLYLGRHAFGNASAGEFAAAMHDAGGRDVAAVITSYIDQPGVPLVAVSSRCDGTATIVSLRQQRFLLRGERTPAIEEQLWTIPVCFSGGDCVLLRERAQTFRLTGCRDTLYPNANGRGYYLTDAVEADGLNSAERVALLRDQWFLVRAGQRNVADFLDAAAAMGSDRSAADEVLSSVATIERYLVEPAQRPALQRWLRGYGAPLVRDLGWTTRPADTPEDRALRNAVLTTLGDHGDDAATRRRARQLTNQWLRDRSTLDPSLVADITKLAAIGGDARLYDAFLRSYRTASDPREKSRMLTVISAFRDPALIRRTLDLALTDDIRSQDLAGVLAGVLSNPAGTAIGWQFVEENWGAIEKKLPPGHTGRLITAVGSAACDRVWMERVKSFVDQHALRQTRQATGLALERIAACADLRVAQGTRLAEWITQRN